MLGLLIILALVGLGLGVVYATRRLVSRRRRAEHLRFEPCLPLPSGSYVVLANDDIIRSLYGASANVHPADSPPPDAVDTWAGTNSDSAAPDRSILGGEGIEELVRRLNGASYRYVGMARGSGPDAARQGSAQARHHH
jgi:hypothetical protein